MTTPLMHQLALVSESQKVSFAEAAVVSAALQKQVMRDFLPIWEVAATVDAFATLEDVPLGYWPMVVTDDIGFDAAGIHLDQDGQPFALITSSDDNDVWSLTASHECLEMLADPFGDRLVPGDSPKSDQGRVLFLVEVCDPSEAAAFGYTANGVLVSDFYTPRYFDPVTANGVRYSFTGAITSPRDVMRGGYLSWLEPVSGHWWQETWFRGNASTFRDLGPLTAAQGSFRSQIDRLTSAETYKAVRRGRSVAERAGLTAAVGHNSSAAKAATLRKQIDQLVGKPGPPTRGAASPKRARPRGGRKS
jgi:hypothetical protein